MIPIIVLLPLAVAMILLAIPRNQFSTTSIAIVGSFLSLLLLPLVTYGSYGINWFSIGGNTFSISLSVTPINYALLFLVLFIGFLVMVYSAGFMDIQSEQRRFFLEMLSFEAAMAVFAVSGNFITLFIAWEFLSLMSYLLIGFWFMKDSAIRAARKALTMVFIGDLALLGAIVIFWSVFGTLNFTSMFPLIHPGMPGIFNIGVLLLLIAVFTKSAQFPFHEWLIDAMEGPTPVSAYLHSSTMVKAGVFVVILLYPFFAAPAVSQIILAFSLITAVIATLAATREMHIKKIAAYSTIQELSLMLVAVSSGAIIAAIYFFVIQAFYKALLFFGAGFMIKSTGNEYIDKITGLRSNKLAYITVLFSILSIAGFIPFSGFFASEGISSSIATNLPLYIIISGIGLLTSFYAFRLFFSVEKGTKNNEIVSNYLGQPRSMLYPMMALALCTLLSSAFFYYSAKEISYGNYLTYLHITKAPSLQVMDSAIIIALAVVGAILAYLVYSRRTIKAKAGLIGRLIYTNPLMNLFYWIAAKVVCEISEGIAIFDSYMSDWFDGWGRMTIRLGYVFRRMASGNVNTYAMIFIIGVIILFASFYYLVIL